MDDIEINRQLALAIGYKTDDVYTQVNAPLGRDKGIEVITACGMSAVWRRFDYKDWNVVGPIAQVYDCFPHHYSPALWTNGFLSGYYETPQKAIALSVLNITGGHYVY